MKKVLFVAMLAIALLIVACAAPTPEPTKAPASSASASSSKAPEPTKAPASSSVASSSVAPSSSASSKAPEPTKAPASSSASAPAVTPRTGGTLKIIVPQLPPAYGNVKDSTWTVGVTGYIFPVAETLVGNTKNGPAPTKLATSWDIAPDGKSITFKLRQGVKFHDGTDFDAQAVKWNLQKIQPHKSELKVITSIDIVDTLTVKLNLSSYSNTLIDNLSWYDGIMLSPASIDGKDAAYVSTHVVGTGPFELVSFSKDTNAVFKKNANYWDKGKPYLDGMEYVVVKDANTAQAALLSGQAQVWDYATTKNIPDLVKQGYAVNTVPSIIRVAFGDSANEKSPFAKKPVREALEYAVDKKALADAFGAGTWEAPVGPCSRLHIGCSATAAQARNYDPAKAKQLLAQGGYPNGFKTAIMAASTIDQELILAIQGYLKAVGIDAEIKILDSAAMTAARTKGWENGILLQGVGVSTASYIQALEVDGQSPTKAYSALVTPEYSALLKKASAATDAATVKTLSEQLAKLVQDEAILTPWVVESRSAVYSKKVTVDVSGISIWFWNPGDAWIAQ